MSIHRLARGIAAAASVFSLIAASAAQACTGIGLTARDGSFIHARTLEFAIDLKSEILMLPRGFKRVGTTPDGKPGLESAAKYASVGMNGLGMNILMDGVNEKGLAAGLFYFPGSAGYMEYTAEDASKTVAPWELGSWMLENFASVAEVRAGLKDIVVPAVVLAQWKSSPEVHYVVRDTSGTSIAVEIIGGEIKVFDAPLGVMTNSPTYDWHMTNLNNYTNLTVNNVPPAKIGSVALPGFGQGSGMLGLPGDFTPPSRFVRAVAFSQSMPMEETGRDTVLQAFHILNNFDIPKGASRSPEKDAHGNIVADYTLWTSAIDLSTQEYFFRTFENSQIRSVKLSDLPIDGTDPVTIPITGEEVIVRLAP